MNLRSLLLFLFWSLLSLSLGACDLSHFTLTSLTGTGPYTITTQLCIGHGVTGPSSGGSPTGKFAFAIFGDTSLSVNSFTPDSVVGPATGVVFKGDTIGSQSAPLSSQENIEFTTTTVGGLYGCSNPPNCGGVTQTCITFTFVMDTIPDSIKVVGIEGSNSYAVGANCNGHSDMCLEFSSFLPVNWLDFYGKHLFNKQNSLTWRVAMEIDCSHYIVRRAEELDHHTHWDNIGRIDSRDRLAVQNYNFIDKQPLPLGYYQVVQYDFNGSYTKSKIISLTNELGITLYPNPSNAILTVSTQGAETIEMLNFAGQQIWIHDLNLEHTKKIDVSQILPGVYFLKLSYLGSSKIEKILIQHP